MNRLILVGGLFFLSCVTEPSANNQSVAVACAANMQEAMDSIAINFENKTGIHCEITAGSSGMLAAQIENGAPYDLFISADMAYPQALYENGQGDKPFNFARGRLVFLVKKEALYKGIEEALRSTNLVRIGMADSRFAPYGLAAEQYLKKIGLKDSLQERLIIGESVGQINHYLATGTVDAAFTSYSFRIGQEEKFTFFEVDSTFFDAINQGALVLNHGKNQNLTATDTLKNYLGSEECKAVLLYFGYLVD